MDQENKDHEEIDLGGAPKDSGTGVKLEDYGWRAVQYYREPNTPKIIQWVMKYSGGIIKNERQAAYTLLIIIAIVVVISIVVWPWERGGKPSPEEIRKYQQIHESNRPK